MFETTVGMKVVGEFDTFKLAFKALYESVMELVKGGCALQILETTVWIVDNDMETPIPVMFYDARDHACEQGWLVDGKLVE